VKLLIISEGKHELHGALETMARRLIGEDDHVAQMKVSDPSLRVHRAKGPGYFKKAVRCLLYAAERGYDALVLLIDQDDQDDRRRQFADAQEEITLCKLPRAMGVAVKTFDAWMLADEQALTKVLSSPIQRQPDPEVIRDAKGMCMQLRDHAGSKVGLAEMYELVSYEINFDLLEHRCPLGFAPFLKRIKQMARHLEL